MSVGGRVIEVIDIDANRAWVNTSDHGEKCAIYLNPKGERIQPGDTVWWQGRHAYWTPQDRSRVEVKFERHGYSGVPKPTPPTERKP